MAYNQMNQAHGRNNGINWATVGLYGGGAAIAGGMVMAGGRGVKNKLQQHGVAGHASRITGIKSGKNWAQLGARELGSMGVGSKKGYRPGARNIASNRRTALNQFRQEVGPASRTPAGSAHAKDIRGFYGNQMKSHVAGTRTKNLLGGKGMGGSAQRAGAAAFGWLGAADYGTAAGGAGGWGRIGASASRMGMVGLGVGMASKGLDWLF